MVEDVAAYAATRHAGLVFVFDELGKFLEHAAAEPKVSDIYFLQQLAERASRSNKLPMALITVLHQSFALYAEGLPERERQEWQKVQGRFEEVPFLEPVDHLVRLTARAISTTESVETALRAQHSEALEGLRPLLIKPKPELMKALEGTLPIHPVVATLLAPLFRGPLAQNERSLFAFLQSIEPGGFGTYVSTSNSASGGLYGVERLYDYVSCVLATRVGTRRHERLFGLADRAIAKLLDTSDGSTQLILKALTLLERFGEEAGLQSNAATIAVACGLSFDHVEAQLEELERYVVHRKYSDTYHLWDGSDVDLDKELEAARQVVEHAGNVAGVLERRVSLRAIVAGRHLHRTGNLRYLEPRLVEDTAFDGSLAPEDPANGLIVYVLPRSPKAGRRLTKQLDNDEFRCEALPHLATVVVVADDAERLRERALVLLSLDQALSSSKALQLDPVARRELELQLNEASNKLLALLSTVFGWGSNGAKDQAQWFTAIEGQVSPPRRLSRLASEVMDEAFDKAPILHNELLNRSRLSSQAAKARRELVEAMINRAHLDNLGFKGHPPALSMYLSIVQKSGVHTPGEGNNWTRPRNEHLTVWKAILALLEDRDAAMRVDELYDHLKQPPHGIREGVLPVILMSLLLALPEHITLFEDGSLVPIVQTEIAERLLRRPKTFAVRAFTASTGRERVLKAILKQLQPSKAGSPTVLNATAALMHRLRSLPAYSQRTNSISATAKRVRTAILHARDPHELLFYRLPNELKIADLVEENPVDYVTALIESLSEIEQAESRLLERLHSAILTRFGARDQAEVVARCAELPSAGLVDLVAGFKLRAQDELPRDEWTFVVATFLVHRPPDKWRDKDEAAFELKLREVARLARRYEQVAQSQWGEGVPRLLLTVLSNDGTQASDFAVVREDEDDAVDALAESFLAEARKSQINRDQLLRALAKVLDASAGQEEKSSA